MACFGSSLCFWGTALLLLLALACDVTTEAAYPNGGGFVEREGTQFVLEGSPFLFNGFNSYWMMHVAADRTERQKVSEVLREAAAAGLTVCRTWAFSDGGDRALQASPGVYDERVFQGLDFVVSEAQRFGVRLILSLANNFKDFGGKAQYVQWARNAGVAVNSEDDFYTNPVVKGYYKDHIKAIFTRYNNITKIAYKDDPAIMAWELINEPRCQVDSSGRTVHAWAKEMAAYAKSLDHKHMLEIGMEGFYGDSMPEKKQYNVPGYQVGTDFISSNLIEEIDFATIHAYPDIWLSGQKDGTQAAFAQRWTWSHWEDARTIVKKPLVFAEFGKSKKDAGYTEKSRDTYLNATYGSIYKYAGAGGTFGGGLVWQLMAEGMEPYYDGYEIVLSRDPPTTGLIARQSHVMSALAHTLRRPASGRRLSQPSHDVNRDSATEFHRKHGRN